jgi:hypothetical protein
VELCHGLDIHVTDLVQLLAQVAEAKNLSKFYSEKTEKEVKKEEEAKAKR